MRFLSIYWSLHFNKIRGWFYFPMKNFILYSTDHCHLCELAETLLVTQLDAQLHTVDVVDIADDDLLLARYGIRIPVLINTGSKHELQWPFDEIALKLFVDK